MTEEREIEEEKSTLRFMLNETIGGMQLEFTIPDVEKGARLNGENLSRLQADKTLDRLCRKGKLKRRGNKKPLFSILKLYKIIKDNIGDIEKFIE